jgi:hypothetical protein
VVIMLELPEGTGYHYVTKITVGAQRFDPARMPQPQTKVPSSKRHRLALADQSVRHPGNRLYVRLTSRCSVQIDTQRKQKAPLNRRINPS